MAAIIRLMDAGTLAGRNMWAARAVVLATFLDLFIQFPVVAPYAREIGATPALVGLIVGVYSATNLVGNLVAGLVLDRWGRKIPVLVGLVVTALALAGYALATTPSHLVAARAVHGLAAAALTPGAFALIGDSAAANRRARAMGTNGALIAVAAVLGPPLAGITRDRLGFGAIFVGGALVMAVATLLFVWLARETLGEARESEGASAGFVALWTRPQLVGAYLAALSLTIGLGTLVTHLPVALVAAGESASRTGLAFTVYAVIALVLMGGPSSRLSDRHGRHGPLAAGLLCMGVGLLVLALGTGFSAAVAGMGTFGLGFGLLFPAATALLTEATVPRERGTAFGIFYAVYSLGVLIGSLMSGVLAEWAGVVTGLPFLVGALVAVAAAPTVLLLSRRPVVATKAAVS